MATVLGDEDGKRYAETTLVSKLKMYDLTMAQLGAVPNGFLKELQYTFLILLSECIHENMVRLCFHVTVGF